MKSIDKVKRFNLILGTAMENDAFSIFMKFLTASRAHGFVVTEMEVTDGLAKKFRIPCKVSLWINFEQSRA